MNDQPLPSFHFQVDWGATRMGFQEVTGLDLAMHGERGYHNM